MGVYFPSASTCLWVSHQYVFENRLFSVKWTNKLLIHDINLTGHRKSTCCLRLLVFLQIESLLCFGIGGPRIFPRVPATMISKRFVKLGIIVKFWILHKIWSKDDSYIIEVYYLPILWKGLEEREGEIKNRRSFLNFTFGQGSWLISAFARSNSNKAVLVQVFLRFEIVIFNNNFVFCMISSFCSMERVADWILAREINR